MTQMPLNPVRRGTRTLSASPQALHAAVLAGFPPGVATTSAEGRVLWRLDERPHDTRLLILSPERPDLAHLVEEAGWPTSSAWQTSDYTGMLQQLTRGQQYAFRLRANPSRQPRDPGLPVTRVGHVTAAQQAGWLLERADARGFSVLRTGDDSQLVVLERRKRAFSRGDRTVTLATATYEGRLEVTDPDALRRTLTNGIGRGKAYGLGLLTLARF